MGHFTGRGSIPPLFLQHVSKYPQTRWKTLSSPSSSFRVWMLDKNVRYRWSGEWDLKQKALWVLILGRKELYIRTMSKKQLKQACKISLIAHFILCGSTMCCTKNKLHRDCSTNYLKIYRRKPVNYWQLIRSKSQLKTIKKGNNKICSSFMWLCVSYFFAKPLEIQRQPA